MSEIKFEIDEIDEVMQGFEDVDENMEETTDVKEEEVEQFFSKKMDELNKAKDIVNIKVGEIVNGLKKINEHNQKYLLYEKMIVKIINSIKMLIEISWVIY